MSAGKPAKFKAGVDTEAGVVVLACGDKQYELTATNARLLATAILESSNEITPKGTLN